MTEAVRMTTKTNSASRRSVAVLAAVLGLVGMVWTVPSFGQGTVMPSPKFTAWDNNGDPVSGAKLCTYVAGTTTPQTTYTDSALAVPNTNPVIVDSAGRATVFLTPGLAYKFLLLQPGSDTTCSTGVTIWTQDNISTVPGSSANVDVMGTAGASLTAGACVYLSDGSSGSAGQWYPCDSANPYSSVLPVIGLAPVAIASGSTGTIRVRGLVTGLSSLTVGGRYFVGTSGAMTTTPPVFAARVGQADTTTSLVVDPRSETIPIVNDFALSLSTGTCFTTADVTAATTIYLTPCTGNRITIFDANSVPSILTTSQISIAVPATTATVYDLWVYNNAGTATLEALAWTNDTTRATALVRVLGVWTKTGDPTRRYVGSFRTTAVSGQTEDSIAKRWLYNAFNRKKKLGRVAIGTDLWTYATNTLRQANADTANQLDFLIGLAESTVHAEYRIGVVVNTAGDATVKVGIGEDSTTTIVAGTIYPVSVRDISTGTGQDILTAVLEKYPAVGRHFYAALEASNATVTVTWYGDNAGASQSGLFGWID